ncbi:sigma factor-like helix-turn-helix DNA-binding protein [Corynebacterium sputi]|uniref:sigma factor-like helix-turn-helix DNA-binding protein n=1 Tax=Corynebacterium sputi TaxID=489915 RepID=UPI00040863C3|nr:sigma factor-like helix-turn-helix DNA-binding protein [Corynebacterium sputi]
MSLAVAEPRTVILVAEEVPERSLRYFADVALLRVGREPQSITLGVQDFGQAVERIGSLLDGHSVLLHGSTEVLSVLVDSLRDNGIEWSALTAEDVLISAGGSAEDDLDDFLTEENVAGRAEELASLIGGGHTTSAPRHSAEQPVVSEGSPVTPEGIEEYLGLLREAFDDGILDGSESEALARTAREHGVSADDAGALHDIFVRRVAVDAWEDGRVTEAEHNHLLAVARQLGVEEGTVVTLLLSDDHSDITLHRNDRIAFHGATAYPREEWDRRISAAGLLRTDLSVEVVCLVTAHGEPIGAAAATARELGVPVIDEVSFSRLLARTADTARPVTPEDLPSVDAPAEVTSAAAVTTVFPWLSEFDLDNDDTGHIAATWVSYFATAPLHTMSPVLDPTQLPDGVPTGSAPVRRWINTHAPVLSASADDLSAIRGVGAVRLQSIVEAVVQEALDAPAPRPAAPPVTDDFDIYWQTAFEISKILGQDDRYRGIFLDRIIGGETLDELGNRFGVTRERVRQLEKPLIDQLLSLDTEEIHDEIVGTVGKLQQWSMVIEHHPGVENLIPETEVPLWRFLEKFQREPRWSIVDRWVVLTGVDDAISSAVSDAVNEYGIAELEKIHEGTDVDPDLLIDWLTEQLGHEVRGGNVLVRQSTIGARAATELSLAGQPLTLAELHELMPGGSVRALSNSLGIYDGVYRCAADTWALAEWEMEEWTGIRDLIVRRIEQSDDDGVSLESLLAEAETFGVSGSSMRSYASGYEFQIEDGVVKFHVGEVTSDTVPEDTRNLYMREGVWHLLTKVNVDNLRGSGMPVPLALTGMYGLAHGGSVDLDGRLGTQTVAWKSSNAQVSSYRRYLEDLGCEAGDRVWLKFGEDFDVIPAPARIEGLDGSEEVLNLMGLEPTDGIDPIVQVNEALGLEEGVARRKTVARLNHRDEIALAELVRAL